MLKKLCLCIADKMYLLSNTDIDIGIDEKNTIAFGSSVVTSYVHLKRVQDSYWLHSLVPDVEVNEKCLEIGNDCILKKDDVIKIHNHRIQLREMETQRTNKLRTFEYLSGDIQKKYALHKIVVEEEDYKIIFATNKVSGDGVLIKAMDPKVKDVIICNEFRRECRLVKKMMFLRHENLTKIIRVEDGMYSKYYVTEYMEAKSIKDYVKSRGKIELRQALDIIIQLADVLSYLYDNLKVLYRDISPENIHITADMNIKLMYFATLKSSNFIDLTSRGSIKSTLLFTAPEIYFGTGDYTIQSDMYALGLLFLHILLGRYPLRSIDDALRFDVYKTTISNDELKSFLIKILHKKPELRFSNYAELIQEAKTLQSKLPQEDDNRSLVKDLNKRELESMRRLEKKIDNLHSLQTQIKNNQEMLISKMSELTEQIKENKNCNATQKRDHQKIAEKMKKISQLMEKSDYLMLHVKHER